MDLSTGKPFGAAARNWSPPFTLATLVVIAVLAMVIGFGAGVLRAPGAGTIANPDAGLVEVRIPSSIAAPPGSAAANSPRSGSGDRGQ
jgi:hypothetical protein